jgi:hypothetical protein
MLRRALYWGSTGLLAALSVFAAFSYLTAAPQAVEGFTHVGYPQQLRVLLGLAKLAGALVLVVPRLPKLKEWAYAGFTFAWVAAFFAHYLAGDGAESAMPVVLLVFLGISYATRPPDRRWQLTAAVPSGSVPRPAVNP